ncbi:MAG: AzlD domain-containing protein [Lachnospiraceae bacterium]
MTVYLYIAVMAAVTYLIRVIPLTVFHKKITNRYVRSFLYYVPYTCLTAMTFPAILYATESLVSALAGVAAAAVFAFCNRSLVSVAAAACLAVFVTELII